ncbi:MAG: TlpA family protein disulfide reductase [Intrasporangium sp.]|uniref:TlpA family protein disulfide reductase n=1 Tax=Intrasporangium sp. TaxID=1925024 RepID=UPI0026470A31|nr:TlpA family protein disulfide reductase [Intrasporangium sp.]MDN5795643.1 TlpA family protein disulfide reductase [Intrasporangium sp.]
MRGLLRLGPIGELDVSQWIGEPPAPTMADLQGRVVAIEAFQMLCPGCVSHGLPQAIRLHKTFGSDLVVIGLHTVFEHHHVTGPKALQAFMYEYRIPFPVAIDRPQERGIPATMERLSLQGTPTLLLVDKTGQLRLNAFGQVEDLPLGAAVAHLLDEQV